MRERVASAWLLLGLALALPLSQALAAPRPAQLLKSLAQTRDARLPGAADGDLTRYAAPGTVQRGRVDRAVLDAREIRVTLPDGREVVAGREREIGHATDSRSWIGAFADQPGSVLVVTDHRGAITGTLFHGDARYELRPTEEGTHVFFRIDESQTPADVVLAAPTALSPPADGGDALVTAQAPPGAGSDGYIHDLLVVYTAAARNRLGQATLESRIITAVALANQAYRNSRVDVLLHLAGMVEVSYTETGDMGVALQRLQTTSDGYLDEVHQLRNQYGADMVLLIDEDSTVGGTAACGIGYVMTTEHSSFASAAFSVVPSSCLSNGSLAHELGHNQGDAHDRATTTAGGEVGGAYPYSYGYRRCSGDGNGFRTVMAYPGGCTGGSFVAYFSSPDVLVNGYPAGIDYEADPANSADNARSMNATADTVAGFRAGSASSVPAAPTGLTASVVPGDTRINLAWTDAASNESGYRVERSTDGVNFSEITVLAANTTAHADTGLTTNLSYWYRVRAYNSKGNSGWSSVASVLLPQPSPPAPPSNLQAGAVTTSSIALSWSDNSTNETNFIIEKTATTESILWTAVAVVGANVTSHTLTGLAPATEYWLRVRAKNAGGNSDSSSTLAVTQGLPGTPAAPDALSGESHSPTTVTLQWVDNSGDETHFEVFFSTSSAWSSAGSAPAGATTFSHAGLVPAATYRYRVTAVNALGSSVPSGAASVTTQVAAVPPAPAALTALASSPSTIDLAWTDLAGNEDDFEIERSSDGGVSFSSLAIVPADSEAWVDSGLEAGVNYAYRVRARNGIGNSAFSNEASAATPVPLGAPFGLTAVTEAADSVRLSWTDTATTETGFELQRRIASLGSWQVVVTLPANATGYTEGDLASDMDYVWRLRALAGADASAFSNEAAATTGTDVRPLPARAARDLAAVDADADGLADLAVLADASRARVRLIDGATGVQGASLSFLDSNWRPVALATLGDANGDGAADDPAIAVLGHNPQLARHRVQIRRAQGGSLIRNIGVFSSSWRVIDVVGIEDADGSPATTDAVLGVLAFQPSTGKTQVQLRKLSDGLVLRTLTYLGSVWTPIAVQAIARPGAAPWIGVLAVKSGGAGEIMVQGRRLDDSVLVKNVYFLDPGWRAQDLVGVADADAGSATDDPAWGVLATLPAGGARRLELRDAASAALVGGLDVADEPWRVIAATVLGDSNGDAGAEFALLGEDPAGGVVGARLIEQSGGTVTAEHALADAAKVEQWQLRLFNSDDEATLALNGQPAGSCAGAGECSFTLGESLLSGANGLQLAIGNAGGGFAYGYEITRNGIIWAYDSCGVAGVSGCEGSVVTGTAHSRDFNLGY